ncbi:cellulase family glycosylhydrolase [Oceanithermus profundus]
MNQKGRWGLLVLMALALHGCAVAKGPAGPALLLGVHAAETRTAAGYAAKLDRAAALGLGAVRVPVDWAQLEPDEAGVFDPAYLEELKRRVADARARGLEVVVLLAQSPAWASGRPEDPAYPPAPEHRADYARALVRLASALQTAGPVRAWEVWNEPNSTEFWPAYAGRERAGSFVLVPLEAAAEYAALIREAYAAMKRAHPQAVVLGGSLAAADVAYLEALWRAFGADVPMDALALHPYARPDERKGPHHGYAQYPDQCNEEIDDLSPPWCFERGLELVRDFLRSKGFDRPLWLTEFGVSSADAWGDAGSEAEQAKHLEITLGILDRRAGPGDLNVAAAIWYRLDDEGEDLFGLYREDGTLKPAGERLRERAGP